MPPETSPSVLEKPSRITKKLKNKHACIQRGGEKNNINPGRAVILKDTAM